MWSLSAVPYLSVKTGLCVLSLSPVYSARKIADTVSGR